jgi:hypothetical protein
MQLLIRLTPWDVRRLTLGQFRRRAEWVAEWNEARSDRGAVSHG